MNTDTLMLVGTLALGLVVGGVAALKIIAPKTKNTVDDAVLARLEAVEKILLGFLGSKDESKKENETPPGDGK